VVSGVPEGVRDLAPSIHRQRLVVEGTCSEVIGAERIVEYLKDLSDVCAMQTLMAPVTHRSDEYGWAGWIHWATSGAHFYAWEDPLFFSVDIYTCKWFSAERAVAFTRDYFHPLALQSREF
jgi:S-adenosylmethionine/arginine decarboxylase-like enzyme